MQRCDPPLTTFRGMANCGWRGSKLPSRVPPRGSTGPQHAGDLCEDGALVSGKVDHAVADDHIDRGIGEGDGAAAAGGVGVSGDVEPVAAPAPTEIRGLQEPIDEPLDRIRAAIGPEILDLARCRRQAYELEVDAADEIARICFRIWLQTHPLETRVDVAIDRPLGPIDPHHR